MTPSHDSQGFRLDALVARASTIAGTAGSETVVNAPIPARPGRRWALIGLLVAGAAATVLGFTMAARQGPDTTTPNATESVPSRPTTAGTVISVAEVSASTAVVPADTTLANTPPTVDSQPASAESPATTAAAAPPSTIAVGPPILRGTPTERLPGGQLWPYGLYQDNIMYLRGTVPDEATSLDIQRRAEEILGADFVRNEVVIDPSVPTVETVIVRLGNSVLFKRGDFDIPPESEPGFILWAAFLQSNPEVTMTVIGHTDAQGSPEYNAALAQQRAEIARDRIIRNGISEARVVAVSSGESDPVASNDTAEGRSLNRRVEFAVTGLFTS